jgi:uncharacterized protein (DUF2062 family)
MAMLGVRPTQIRGAIGQQRPSDGPDAGNGGFLCAVVVPTFNHCRPLLQVLQSLSCHPWTVIVVDDGSTDGTAGLVSGWGTGEAGDSQRVVVHHKSNRGKAAAIHTGLLQARSRGFTHVATIDSDGQHDVGDLKRLLECASQNREAIVIGSRIGEAGDVPVRSRVGRVLSNRLAWLESGIKVTDSQSGMRVYPIASTVALGTKASRYAFETEVLVQAGWRGVPIIEQGIQTIYDPPEGRTTHFKVWSDTLAAVGMHTRLLVRALGPRLSTAKGQATGTILYRLRRWFSPRGLGQLACGDVGDRHRFAASIGVGLLIATVPIYGAKTLVCLWVAARWRLHPLAVVGMSSLSTPPIGLLFVVYAIVVGSIALGGGVPDLAGIDIDVIAQWSTARDLMLEWIVGSVIGGVALGLVAYSLLRIMLGRSRRKPPSLDLENPSDHRGGGSAPLAP